MGLGIINTSNLNPNTLLPNKPATQASVRAVDNSPANAAAIAAAAKPKTTGGAKKVASAAAKPPDEPKVKKAVQLIFPEDFPWQYGIVLAFGPYTRQAALENKLVDHDLGITLPLPSNLGESFGATYNNASLGPFMGPLLSGMSSAVSDIQSGTDWRKAITDKIAKGINNLKDDKDYTWAKVGAIQAARGGGEALGTGVSMAMGMAPNPNMAVGFQGVPLRTLSFSWRLAPRSIEESKTALEIVTYLKQRMLPVKEGFALRYPDYCTITLFSGPISDMIKFKTCVLSDMKVNYAPNGVPSFFADTRLPTEIDLSLTFNETQIFTREDYEQIPQP